MRRGQVRDSRGNVYRNTNVAMQYLSRRINATLGEKLRDLSDQRVLVGLPEGSDDYPGEPGEETVSVIDVGFWNEFGTEHIPARPFLRTTVANNTQKYLTMIEKDFSAVLENRLAPASLWHRVGSRMQADVQNAIAEWTTPPNAPSTQRQKGKKASRKEVAEYMRTAAKNPTVGDQKIGLSISNTGAPMINNPLSDTGHLEQAIRYVVEDVNES